MALQGFSCVQAFFSCSESGLLFAYFSCVWELLIAVTCVVAEHGALEHRLSSCGPLDLVATWHMGSFPIRDPTGPPSLPGRFFPTEPPEKPLRG